VKIVIFGITIKIRKEFVVIGIFILLIFLTIWGWYLKTNRVEVFYVDEVTKQQNSKSDNRSDKNHMNSAEEIPSVTVTPDPGKEPQGTPYELTAININTADISELIKLHGIGTVKARAIIEYRQQNGPFKSIEEIKNVKGIGEVTFNRIKDYITADIE
jgi:competence protein ComEA